MSRVSTLDGASRRLRFLCLFIIIAACSEFVIATTGVQIRHLPHSTDFATYYLAGQQANDRLSPYDRAAIIARGHALGFDFDQFPFLYPPPFALAMRPLAQLDYPRARQVWMLLSTLEILAALAVTAALVRRQARRLEIEDERRVWIVFAAFVPAALNSTSLHNDVRAGSVGSLLWLSLAAFAWAMLQENHARRRGPTRFDLVGGIAIAVASLAKLAPGLLLPWATWRRAGWLVGVGISLLTISMLPAIAHWGPGILLDYWQHAILPSLRGDVAPPMNQSLQAFLSRLFISNASTRALVQAPGLEHALVLILSVGIAGFTLRTLLRPIPRRALLAVEMAAVLLAILALMKLTWVQTLTSMLWVWPVLMVVILRAAERGAPWARRAGLGACIGFFLSSAHVPILWEGLRHGPALLVTGVHLLGVLVLWAICLEVLERERRTPTVGAIAG